MAEDDVLNEDSFHSWLVPYIVWAATDAHSSDAPDCPVFLYQSRATRIVSFTFTLDHYVKFFTDPDFLIILWRSLLDRI